MKHSLASILVRALAAGMLLSTRADPQQAGSRPDAAPAMESRATNPPGVRVTSKVEVSTVDDDGNGLLERAVVEVEVEVLIAGEYSLSGTLEKHGRAVSNRPAWDCQLFSRDRFSATPGIYRGSLAFSGEQILPVGRGRPLRSRAGRDRRGQRCFIEGENAFLRSPEVR